MRVVLLLLAALMLSGQRDPVLVPEISQHEVRVRQGFTGTELLLFGAVLDPGGQAAGDYEIVVVLKGPSEPIRLREKERFAGVWVNAESSDFRSVPSFFAVASSAPISDIVDERTAAIFEFGTDYIQLSPTGAIDPDALQRFAAGLVDLKRRQGLYKEDFTGVRILERVLYQARISLPSNVTTGTYTAETFAVSEGRVVSSATTEVAVRKVGFERFVEDSANRNGLAYGLIAVLLSVGMGWGAGRLFARL